MNALTRGGLLAALAALAAGCGDHVNLAELQPFLVDGNCPVATRDYRVLPPDIISISSQSVPEMNGVNQPVRPDGRCNLPLIGEVEVANKTPKQIEQAIEEATKEYYGRADVTVHVAAFQSQRVYVFGQVKAPGPQPYTGADTLLDVLCKAQPTLFAWNEQVKLIRGGTPCRGGYAVPAAAGSDGKPAADGPSRPAQCHEMTVNLIAMINRGDLRQNVMLRPDDVIYVPPHPLAHAGLVLNQLLFPLRQVAETAQIPNGNYQYTQQTVIGGP